MKLSGAGLAKVDEDIVKMHDTTIIMMDERVCIVLYLVDGVGGRFELRGPAFYRDMG